MGDSGGFVLRAFLWKIYSEETSDGFGQSGAIAARFASRIEDASAIRGIRGIRERVKSCMSCRVRCGAKADHRPETTDHGH